MSRILVEAAKITATGGTTMVGMMYYHAIKSVKSVAEEALVSNVPVPGIAERALGGALELVKGASSLPFVKEAAISALSIAGVSLLWYNGRVRARVEESVQGLKERFGVVMQEVASKRVNEFIPESMRSESSEQDSVMPKIQVKVGHVAEGAFVLYGSAVRIHEAIVMPAHVLTSARDDTGHIWVKGSQGSLKFTVDSFEMIDTDLVARQLKPEEFSKIGMAQVRLAENLPNVGEFVSICGVKNKGTVGKLKHDSTAFGKVVYSGTTMAGYSGAPYMKGTSVMGIHCWGGKVNGGYSASYVKLLVARMLRERPESSEDWLNDKLKRKSIDRADIKFDQGADEAWFKYNGQYHLCSGDVFRKAGGLDYLDYNSTPQMTDRIKRATGDYGDSDSMRVEEALRHSGESKSLQHPGASGDVSQPGDIELLVIKSLTQMLSSLSNKQLKSLRNSAESSKQGTSMTGLLSDPKQN